MQLLALLVLLVLPPYLGGDLEYEFQRLYLRKQVRAVSHSLLKRGVSCR